MAANLTVDVLDTAGKKSGTVELPASIFDVQTNVALIHQVVVAQQAAARQGTHKAKTRVGRGEGSKGKTAGRGTKGTGARKNVPEFFAGGQMPIHMQAPKLGGFHNPFRTEYQVVNLDKVEALFPKGGKITVDDLVSVGAVRDNELVKVLGTGELTVKVDLVVDAWSKSAQEKIEKAGGSVTKR